jgi:hypothetical protein
VFRGLLEYVGLVAPTPKTEQKQLNDAPAQTEQALPAIDAEYVQIPDSNEANAAILDATLAGTRSTQQHLVEESKRAEEMKWALEIALKKQRQLATGDNTPNTAPSTLSSAVPKPADMKHILTEMATKHAEMLQRIAQSAAAQVEPEPTFSIEPGAFDHHESVQKLASQSRRRPYKIGSLEIHTNIRHEDELNSQKNSDEKSINGYHRLVSDDFTHVNLMHDSLDLVETGEENELNISTLDELIGYYNDVSPEFDKLKERFQSTTLLQSAEQTTILFPTLQQYQPTSPSLNFRQMSNLTYLNQKALNLVTNFNNYINFNLPKIKMYREMIESNQIDDKTIERACTVGFESAEQMRRTSYSIADLLEKAETFNNDMDAVGNTVVNTLSGMTKKLDDARHELQLLHITLHDYQIKKQYSHNSTELERRPLLVSAFR